MYKVILICHIITGAVALGSGAWAIGSKKRANGQHTAAGRTYMIAMYGIAVTALVMTVIKFNPFLMAIALFSLYLSYSGRRAIYYWRLRATHVPATSEKIPYYLAIATAIFMIVFPLVDMWQRNYFSVPILSIFGLVMLIFSVRDVRLFARPENFEPGNKMWLMTHIGKMGGAYIATFTAFLLNNISMEPAWLVWIGPSLIGTPVITYTIINWRKKLGMD